MAIANRDLDSSEQNRSLAGSFPTVTGQTYVVASVPYPSQLMAAQVDCVGLSGSPNLSLWLHRFNVGQGFTSINVGASLVAAAFGLSGGQTFAVAAPGVTYPLQTGDLIVLSTAAANTGSVQTTVSIVIKALQDFRTSFGSTS